MAAPLSKDPAGHPSLSGEEATDHLVDSDSTRSKMSSYQVGIFICVLLVAITWFVFGQTLAHDFVNFDDDQYVYENREITKGLSLNGVVAAFTQPHAHNWHPVTTLSHMLDCQLYGLHAPGHHLTNVVLHTIAVLLLFGVLRQMTGALWRSALVAAVFAIHPLHVESVAWISERKDVLSAVFFCLMLAAYVRYARAPSLWRYLTVALFFSLGLMSKAMLVTAPFVLLLLDYWPLKRTSPRHRLFLEKVPLMVLSAASCLITFALQKKAAGAIAPLPLTWRVENAIASYVVYLWQTFWPTHLAVFYPHLDDSLPLWQLVGAVVVLLAVTAAAVVLRKSRPYLFMGWLWYLGMLLPVIGIVQVGEQGRADRYTYLSHIGLFLMMVWGAADLAAFYRLRQRLVAAVAVTIMVALSWRAFIQAFSWRDSETLWTHALAVTSNNDIAHNNLGYLCEDRGNLDKAILHFEAALRIRSNKRHPHYNVGSAYIETNLADALTRKGQPDQAVVHYEEAIRLQPDYADAYYSLGTVLSATGRIDEALTQWYKALEIQPNHADAHASIGDALLQGGSVGEAMTHYEEALQIAPDGPAFHNNIAWILATSSDAALRDGTRAVKLAKEAVALSGGKQADFFRTLAAAYAETDRFADAISTAKQGYLLAGTQKNSALATKLLGDVALYRKRIPLRQVFTTN